jgi:hypothetical protein
MSDATNGHGFLYLVALLAGVPTGVVLYEAIEYLRWLRRFRLCQRTTPTIFQQKNAMNSYASGTRNQCPSPAADKQGRVELV